jgi:hypothetical protein
VTRIEHPFAKVYRAVLKEKYPDKDPAIPESSPLAVSGIPEDVMKESLKRYFADKKLIIGPRVQLHRANAGQKPKPEYTITYV